MVIICGADWDMIQLLIVIGDLCQRVQLNCHFHFDQNNNRRKLLHWSAKTIGDNDGNNDGDDIDCSGINWESAYGLSTALQEYGQWYSGLHLIGTPILIIY